MKPSTKKSSRKKQALSKAKKPAKTKVAKKAPSKAKKPIETKVAKKNGVKSKSVKTVVKKKVAKKPVARKSTVQKSKKTVAKKPALKRKTAVRKHIKRTRTIQKPLFSTSLEQAESELQEPFEGVEITVMELPTAEQIDAENEKEGDDGIDITLN